jgi:hypothetical protein
MTFALHAAVIRSRFRSYPNPVRLRPKPSPAPPGTPCGSFRKHVSVRTLDETGRGESAMANDRLALIRDLPMLEVSDTAAALTRTLLAKGLIPTKAASDAIHIAVASVHAIDYLVTWNFRHIANPFIRNRLREVVLDSGFTLPVICTPRNS